MLVSSHLVLCSLLALTARAEQSFHDEELSAQTGSFGGVEETCSADGSCPDADRNDNSKEDSPSVGEIPDGVVLELLLDNLLQSEPESRAPDAIFEMARAFSKDPRHTQFADLSEIDRRLLFVKRVKLLMDSREQDKRGGEPETGTQPEGQWQYPALTMLEPGQVGDVAVVELVAGRTHKRITRAVHPPVFEIPEFLTDEECDTIVGTAEEIGVVTSRTFGGDDLEQMAARASADITRLSDQTWLYSHHVEEEFRQSLQSRLAALTSLPLDVIQGGEPMQVVTYSPGGHYHAHLDSSDLSEEPCCHQKACGDILKTTKATSCCRLCRYITVLYYLNDVELGGETAFPLADMSEELLEEKLESDEWENLSRFCHNSSLVVKPKKGTAIMWYNHFLDDQGYLGEVNNWSHHGGCDLLKGTKWIANNWLTASGYRDRFKPSIFHK